VTPTLRVLSLGAGVQSTTLALMAAHHEIEPLPDCAIFADTGWEPRAVYDHLDRLEPMLPFPVYRVSDGDIRDTIATDAYDPIPWHVPSGMGRRQCTKQFKLYPIRRKVRELLGGKTPRGGCEMWIGISRDEAHRMKPSRVKYIQNRWPLIALGLTRRDCHSKLAGWGVDAPRSACCGCPFLSDHDWQLRRQQPEWAETVAISHRLAATGQYMHRSLRPIDEVDLRTHAERGQPDLFAAECDGICGV
jgi:hypothetical protein